MSLFRWEKFITISKDVKEYIVDEIGVEKNKVVVISNWSFEKHSNENFSDSWKNLDNINIFNDNYIVIGYGVILVLLMELLIFVIYF